ncbi:MAG TPA: hypothetical protein VFV38_38805 [Ktedonobacteraceae bacterium]|nr:hypothetical protein [Ktedonobacteraceae bacterium]
MIRCNHCGKLAPAGATSCQNCGMPLTTVSGGLGMGGEAQAEQQELPAWLESLRAHERPVANNSGGQPFTMDELVDENAMPSWMRQDQSRLMEAGASDSFPALPAAAKTEDSRDAFPGSGLEASSLIDKQSLPSWMSGAQEGMQPTTGQNVSAHSLVQSETLPAWMKNLAQEVRPQPSALSTEGQNGLPARTPFPERSMEGQYGLPVSSHPTPPAPGATRMPQTPALPVSYNDPATVPTQGFSAHELVDQRALPGWMADAQGPGQQAQSQSVPTGSGFAAGELIDQRALPRWMKDLQGPEKSDPVSAWGGPVNGSGQGTGMGQGVQGGAGMSASTLLDTNALPAWMREGEQGGVNTDFPAAANASGSMAAGSLIDMNAVPAWLKNADNTQQSGGAHPGQARTEGMRVPSRPRSEAGPQEQSAAAANVFSSMLGVSASAPTLSNQPQEHTLGVAPAPQPQQVQPSLPGWQSPPQPPANYNAQPWQQANQLPPLENRMGAVPQSSPMPGSYMAGNQPGSMPGQKTYSGSLGSAEAARRPITPGMGGSSGGVAEGPKKKGLFDAIRDFFFH